MGTCRMGSSAKTSVVDTCGQSWQVAGLYVADASLFPTALGINPMVTVEALAYVVANSVAERLTGTRVAAEVFTRRTMDNANLDW